jgi:hypothetical protein
MASSDAVNQASRLSEIGFPEFTTKLVTDVFDALVSANIRQTESYVELLQKVSKSLTEFINDTKDDIGGDEIMQFLSVLAPPADAQGDSEEPSKVKPGGELTVAEGDALRSALTITGVADNEKAVPAAAANKVTIDQAAFDKILDAVATRIAANKYDLLKEMVKQGILRLVVDDGLIETKLTFSTYGSSFYQSNSSKYNRKSFEFRAKAKTSGFASLWVKAAASTKYNSIGISTTNTTNQDRSGSRVNIFGLVRINFRTDYLPLNN